MTKKEFALFVMALRTYYPRENLLPNDEAMDLWFAQLQDIPYKIAQAGLQKWVATNKWSPSIADIREMTSGITFGEIPDWGEAWSETQKAIRRFGSYRVAEALESLSPLTRKVVERIGFMNLCMSDNESADRANFRMIYETLAERQKRDAQLPAPLKEMLLEIKGSLLLEDKND